MIKDIHGVKWSCDTCIRGHRSRTCTHHQNKPLRRVERQGNTHGRCRLCQGPRHGCVCYSELRWIKQFGTSPEGEPLYEASSVPASGPLGPPPPPPPQQAGPEQWQQNFLSFMAPGSISPKYSIAAPAPQESQLFTLAAGQPDAGQNDLFIPGDDITATADPALAWPYPGQNELFPGDETTATIDPATTWQYLGQNDLFPAGDDTNTTTDPALLSFTDPDLRLETGTPFDEDFGNIAAFWDEYDPPGTTSTDPPASNPVENGLSTSAPPANSAQDSAPHTATTTTTSITTTTDGDSDSGSGSSDDHNPSAQITSLGFDTYTFAGMGHRRWAATTDAAPLPPSETLATVWGERPAPHAGDLELLFPHYDWGQIGGEEPAPAPVLTAATPPPPPPPAAAPAPSVPDTNAPNRSRVKKVRRLPKPRELPAGAAYFGLGEATPGD